MVETFHHKYLVKSIAEHYLRKGYRVIKDGERSRMKEFRGLSRVDIIAVKGNELLLIECGGVDSPVWRFAELKEEVSRLSLNKNYRIRILWYPYLYTLKPHCWFKR
jgi:hypothetical protein